MKKLLSLLGVVTITGTSLTTLTSTNFISTKLENSNINLKNINQFRIDRNDFRIIFNTERWGNNSVMRFGHNAVQWLRNNSRNARDVFATLSTTLGIGAVFTPENIQKVLGVSSGVAGLLSIMFGRWNENPESLVNSIIDNEDEDEGNGLDLNIRESETGHVSITVRRANTYPF